MQQQRQSPPGSCFRCKKPGHWAKFCPQNPSNRSPVSKPVTSDQQFPATYCRCGRGLCRILVSNSVKNPNRKYYCCHGTREMDCGYFKWCDKLKIEEIREVQPKSYPICECGAGICSVIVEHNGLAERSYFGCPVKKEQGACNFKQWLDYSIESMLDEYDFDLSPQDEMIIDAIETLACESPAEGQVQMEGEEKEMAGTRETHAYPIEINISENQMYNSQVDNMQTSVSTSLTAVVAASNKGVHLDPSTNAGLQYCSGWTAQNVRLYPQGATVPAMSSLFSFPENLPPPDAHIQDRPYLNSPSLLNGGLQVSTTMTSTILPAFQQLALQLQNDLITLLESMDPQNHETMTKEAHSTFSALNNLQVDFSQFQLRVNEYIKQAAYLFHIEQIIQDDTSPQELVDHRDDEQQRFEELLKSHQEAKHAYIRSSSLFCEKTSSFGNSVTSVELASCTSEAAECQESLLQITKTMKECKKSLQAACLKAEEAIQKSEERERERNAVQVAFQTARARLRN